MRRAYEEVIDRISQRRDTNSKPIKVENRPENQSFNDTCPDIQNSCVINSAKTKKKPKKKQEKNYIVLPPDLDEEDITACTVVSKGPQEVLGPFEEKVEAEAVKDLATKFDDVNLQNDMEEQLSYLYNQPPNFNVEHSLDHLHLHTDYVKSYYQFLAANTFHLFTFTALAVLTIAVSTGSPLLPILVSTTLLGLIALFVPHSFPIHIHILQEKQATASQITASSLDMAAKGQ